MSTNGKFDSLESKTNLVKTTEVDKKGHLTVIGLGHAGLPTAIILAKNGWKVSGVDTNKDVIDKINSGQIPFIETSLEKELVEVVRSGLLTATGEVSKSDVYIISVPFPPSSDTGIETNISSFDETINAIVPILTGDELIILESTAPPGTTEQMAQRILAKRPDLSVVGEGGKPTIHFAYAAKSVSSGYVLDDMATNDRIIGSLTMAAAEKAQQIYASFCEGRIEITDALTAEMAKWAEIAFRNVNAAFRNELSIIADQYDLDIRELIELTNLHTRVHTLTPGSGVITPYNSSEPRFTLSVAETEIPLITTAHQANQSKPKLIVKKVESELNRNSVDHKTVSILGLASIPNSDNMRNSAATSICIDLAKRNPDTNFLVADPYLKSLPSELDSCKNVELTLAEQAIDNSALVLLLVAHEEFAQLPNPTKLGKIVIDTSGLWYQ